MGAITIDPRDDDAHLVRPQVRSLDAYVPGKRPPAGKRAWKLSSNENPYPPLPSVQRAIIAATEQVNRYPDMQASEVAAAYAAHLGLPAQLVVAGTGSVAMLTHVLQAVLRPGEEVIYAWRSFEAYPIAVAVCGGVSVQVPLDRNSRHDLTAMANAITAKTRVVLICSPNNPTGPAVHAAELRDFLARIPPQVLVVIDEAYLEFVSEPEADDAIELLKQWGYLPQPKEGMPQVVVLRTMSKAFGLAGLRVGFAIAPIELADAIRAVTTPFGVSSLTQAAALASLEPDALTELHSRVMALKDERDRVLATLRAQGWIVPDSGANFVWLPVGELTDKLAAEAMAAGLVMRPFTGEGLRVTIGEAAANDAFLDLAQLWISADQRPTT